MQVKNCRFCKQLETNMVVAIVQSQDVCVFSPKVWGWPVGEQFSNLTENRMFILYMANIVNTSALKTDLKVGSTQKQNCPYWLQLCCKKSCHLENPLISRSIVGNVTLWGRGRGRRREGKCQMQYGTRWQMGSTFFGQRTLFWICTVKID